MAAMNPYISQSGFADDNMVILASLVQEDKLISRVV